MRTSRLTDIPLLGNKIVIVDDAAEHITTLHCTGTTAGSSWYWIALFDTLRRPMFIIVSCILLYYAPHVRFVDDQDAIQTLVSGRLDPPLGERIRGRCSEGCSYYLDVFSRENPVKGQRELGVAITDQKFDCFVFIL